MSVWLQACLRQTRWNAVTKTFTLEFMAAQYMRPWLISLLWWVRETYLPFMLQHQCCPVHAWVTVLHIMHSKEALQLKLKLLIYTVKCSNVKFTGHYLTDFKISQPHWNGGFPGETGRRNCRQNALDAEIPIWGRRSCVDVFSSRFLGKAEEDVDLWSWSSHLSINGCFPASHLIKHNIQLSMEEPDFKQSDKEVYNSRKCRSWLYLLYESLHN